jgi:hypothetical protein
VTLVVTFLTSLIDAAMLMPSTLPAAEMALGAGEGRRGTRSGCKKLKTVTPGRVWWFATSSMHPDQNEFHKLTEQVAGKGGAVCPAGPQRCSPRWHRLKPTLQTAL